MKQAWKISGVMGAILIVAVSCAAPRMPPRPPKPPTPPRPPHGPSALVPQQQKTFATLPSTAKQPQEITDLSIAYPQK